MKILSLSRILRSRLVRLILLGAIFIWGYGLWQRRLPFTIENPDVIGDARRRSPKFAVIRRVTMSNENSQSYRLTVEMADTIKMYPGDRLCVETSWWNYAKFNGSSVVEVWIPVGMKFPPAPHLRPGEAVVMRGSGVVQTLPIHFEGAEMWMILDKRHFGREPSNWHQRLYIANSWLARAKYKGSMSEVRFTTRMEGENRSAMFNPSSIPVFDRGADRATELPKEVTVGRPIN